MSWFEDWAKWRDLAGFIMIETSRWEGGKWTDPDVRCYLTSLAADARRLRRIARAHWGVENRLHWVLAVAFGEDYCRARCGLPPIMRHPCRLSEHPLRGTVHYDILRANSFTERE